MGSGVPASLTNVTVSSNIAQGGGGGGYDSTFTKRACYSGGDGFGGGMYVYYGAASVESAHRAP